MYIVETVDLDNGEYVLVYHKKQRNRNRIPIKTIDKKSNKCDGDLVGAIFG
jgi:hypothetical protein